MHAAAQFNTLQPVRDEQRALDPAQLAQGHGQSVLARVAAELAQHQRGGDGALLDRAGRAQDVVPVGTHVLDVQGAADQRAQRRVGTPCGTYSLVSPRSRMRGAKRKPSRCIRAKT